MGIEDYYANKIDKEKEAPLPENIGFDAEDIAGQFLEEQYPEFTVEESSTDEDSGLDQIVKGERIDRKIILKGKVVMVAQITTARDPKVIGEKQKLLIDSPFVKSVPRVLVFLNPKDIEECLNDSNSPKKQDVMNKIQKDIIGSLQFDLTKTKNPLEQENIKTLIDILKGKTRTSG